jgi:hypothetical protein
VVSIRKSAILSIGAVLRGSMRAASQPAEEQRFLAAVAVVRRSCDRAATAAAVSVAGGSASISAGRFRNFMGSFAFSALDSHGTAIVDTIPVWSSFLNYGPIAPGAR